MERSPLRTRCARRRDASLLAGDEDAAEELFADKAARRQAVVTALDGFDGSEDGWLSREEAEDLFARLARGIVTELADGKGGAPELTQNSCASRARGRRARHHQARRHQALPARRRRRGRTGVAARVRGTFRRRPLGAGRRDVPATAPGTSRARSSSCRPRSRPPPPSAADRSTAWHIGVPGDDHTLRTVQCDGFSIVGIGRSADASAPFVPELGVCFDAGLSVASLAPRSVFLTHGHRDHTAALPVLAAQRRASTCPEPSTRSCGAS